MSRKVKLGDVVEDQVTGLVGMVVSRVEHLNGCIRFEVQPKVLKDGKPVDSSWVDIDQAKLVSATKKKKVSATPPGGPHNTPPSLSTPG